MADAWIKNTRNVQVAAIMDHWADRNENLEVPHEVVCAWNLTSQDFDFLDDYRSRWERESKGIIYG